MRSSALMRLGLACTAMALLAGSKGLSGAAVVPVWQSFCILLVVSGGVFAGSLYGGMVPAVRPRR